MPVEIYWSPDESKIAMKASYGGVDQTIIVDAKTGALSLKPESHNYLPPDLDAEGRVKFEGAKRIRLEEMWLGSAKRATEERACAHVFER